MPVEKVCKEWNLWHAYFDWPEGGVTGSMLSTTPKDSNRVEWLTLIAVPLFPVSGMGVVQGLMESPRAKPTPAVPR